MPKTTQTRKNLEEFANIFLKTHSDKMHEINTHKIDLRQVFPFNASTPGIEWTDALGCKWYLRKSLLLDFRDIQKPPLTEYRLRREYPKLTKRKSEKTIHDGCWIYIPSELEYKPLNDSRNAVIEGYYFEKYSGFRPCGYSAR